MKIELLSEDLFSESELISEASADGKTLILSGIIMQGDVKNRNNRNYPKEEIEKAVHGINERLKTGESIMGELDHPQTLSINLDRVSHVLTEASMVGSNAVGKMKVINTPMGNIVKTLITAGVKLGVSSRGTGKVGNDGNVSEYAFSTMDIVAQPSAPDAYPESVMESLQVATNGHIIVSLAEAVVNDPKAQKYFEAEMTKFIRSLISK